MPSPTPEFLPAHKIFIETKPGIRYYKILKTLPDIPEGISKQPYIDEMKRILQQLYNLQKDSVKLECAGETEQAIAGYKQLVAAQFDSPYPYLRLCAYYTQKQMPVQVDIVCCRYLKMVQIVTALGYSDPCRNESTITFIEIANELEKSSEIEEYCEKLLAREYNCKG
jgi:hypothetical protein